MKQTLFVRLEHDKTQFEALLETVHRFNDACNYIASVAYKLKTANKMRLQKEAYGKVREEYGLSAQMTIRAISKVCEAYKRDKSRKPTFKPHGAMVYDQRIGTTLNWDLTGRINSRYLYWEGNDRCPSTKISCLKPTISHQVHVARNSLIAPRSSGLDRGPIHATCEREKNYEH